ncbi:MAG: hypothetical protein QOF61_193, partial [Acidobacteriota bacterium]|nr:hypothetical protein [Acidobacteriota bacterium]
KQAATLRPNHSRLMYFVAVAYALNGNTGEALSWLDRVARLGVVVPAGSDENFNSIKDSAEFKVILEKFRRNALPIVRSIPAFTIHEKGVVPESVAYDRVAKNFYLSSIYKRKILRVGASGEATEFATARDGLWSVAGMKVDAARRLLWACTVAHPQMSGYKEEENGTTGLLKFDLRTGRLIKKYLLPNHPQPHWLGDLAINSRGDVFATDSITPAIYIVRQDRDEIETFLESEQFSSPQGLDFTPDEKHLFMADYAKGLFLVDLATKKITLLPPPPDSTLLGIDGLYFHNGALVAVQNGTTPPRIIRLILDKTLSRLERFETLEANNPIFDDPTLGVVVKDWFYFIANSQWGAIDEKGNLAPAEKLKDPVILKLKL